MLQDWLKAHEALIGSVVNQTSKLLNLQQDVVTRVTWTMKTKLHPLTATMSDAFTAYRNQMAHFFGQIMREELLKISDFQLQKAGLLTATTDKLYMPPIDGPNKFNAELDELRNDIKQLKGKNLDLELRLEQVELTPTKQQRQMSALEAQMESFLSTPPEKHEKVSSGQQNRFSANLKKWKQIKGLNMDLFKIFAPDDAPIVFDDSVEFAKWDFYQGMRSIQTGNQEGICLQFYSDGDFVLCQWKNGKKHGLNFYFYAEGNLGIYLYRDASTYASYCINPDWSKKSVSGDYSKLEDLLQEIKK